MGELSARLAEILVLAKPQKERGGELARLFEMEEKEHRKFKALFESQTEKVKEFSDELASLRLEPTGLER